MPTAKNFRIVFSHKTTCSNRWQKGHLSTSCGGTADLDFTAEEVDR